MESSVFGTVDRVVIRGTHVDVVDFKFGRGEIDDAEINIQGQAYLLGVMDKFPELETATVHFIIPRRDEVFTADFTRADMEGIRLRIGLIVGKAMLSDAERIPNTEGCKYCKHKLSCPALNDKMLPLAKKYAKTVDDFELNLWGSYSPAEIEDPEVLGKMLNVASVVDKWAEAAKKQATKLATDEGLEIPGYDLHFRTATAKIGDSQAAFDAVEHLLSAEEFMNACNVTPTALGKAYSEKLPRGEKKDARAKIDNALEDAGVILSEEERSLTPYLRKSKNLS
jgi:hypothetical protein